MAKTTPVEASEDKNLDASILNDNIRATQVLREARQNLSVEQLQGKIQTLQSQLKRSQYKKAKEQ